MGPAYFVIKYSMFLLMILCVFELGRIVGHETAKICKTCKGRKWLWLRDTGIVKWSECPDCNGTGVNDEKGKD